MKKLFLMILTLAILFFSRFETVFAYTYTTCTGGSTSCSCTSGSIDCPCPDGTCYITCNQRTCSDCTKQGCWVNGGGITCYNIGTCTCTSSAGGTRYPNGSSVSCCSQINCNCTPTCTAGASTTVTGSLCSAGTSSCSQSNSCSSCTSTGAACYYPETNVIPPTPNTISMIIDGKTYQLSTNPNNPTKLKLPKLGASNVQITVPTFTAPATSRGGGYYFTANNYGINDEWRTWVSCSGIAGEDFCTTVPNTNNTQSFVPTSKTINQVLKEGATGKISGMYTTTDKCGNTYKYSLPIEGYYLIDTLPHVSPSPDSPTNNTTIIDPQDLVPSIGTDITTNACQSSTYTGSEINNPLHIIAQTSDTNTNDEIQSFTIWLSQDSSIPTTTTITSSYTGSTNTDLGIMIKKNGTDWTNPSLYGTNSSLDFGQITDGYIKINNENIIRIYDLSVTQDTNIIFDYKLEFLNNSNTISALYHIYGGALDTNMFNDATIDQSYFAKFFDWNIDLVNPILDNIVQQIQNPTNTNLTWSVTDSQSGIGRTVINGYRTGGIETDTATLFDKNNTNKGALNLVAKPLDNAIGLYTDTNAWIFDNNAGETDRLNIGTNEGGAIDIYVTAYDNACNSTSTSEKIDLDPWFATRGGAVYSENNISKAPKDVSQVSSLDNVFNSRTLMTKSLIDLGTELLATRNTNISVLIHSNSGAAKAILAYDSNNIKLYWFNTLLEKFNILANKSSQFSSLTTRTSIDCTGETSCYMHSTAPTEDIHIPKGYQCDRPTLFISEGNIYIEPNITSDITKATGCIFIAKNNIYIGAGDYQSTGSVIEYDYIEGFLIAENQVIFSPVDTNQTLRDGIEMFGGIVAFGSNSLQEGNAISIERNMRLFNQTNPTIVLTYDNKYSYLSTFFFGTEATIYKQEVGFKSF